MKHRCAYCTKAAVVTEWDGPWLIPVCRKCAENRCAVVSDLASTRADDEHTRGRLGPGAPAERTA